MVENAEVAIIQYPQAGGTTVEWVHEVMLQLDWATRNPGALKRVLPAATLCRLLDSLAKECKALPTVIDVSECSA
jgi:hypothetical protein